MGSLLVVVDLPSTEPEPVGEYDVDIANRTKHFEGKVGATALQTAGSKQIARNVWLLDAENSWPVLQALSEAARTCRFKLHVSLIEGVVTAMT